MSKRFSILLAVLTIISGAIAGATSGRIFATKIAAAEETNRCGILTVEGLRVVDKENNLLMALGKRDVAKIPFDDYGLYIFDGNGRIMSFIRSDESEGVIGVFGKDYKGGTVIMINESGGTVDIFGKDGKRAARIGMDKSGNGVVGLWDKNGYKLR